MQENQAEVVSPDPEEDKIEADTTKTTPKKITTTTREAIGMVVETREERIASMTSAATALTQPIVTLK